MAGPGGGPSRRSHTKSRKGCKTCKKRHIRCDEAYPQCRNCTKHQVRCDYQDTTANEEESKSPPQVNLMMTPEIEKAVHLWQQSGRHPFPDLVIRPQPQWHAYSTTELRLVHHALFLCNEMHLNHSSKLTMWTAKLPRFVSSASHHPFLMHAILSISAANLAWLSQSAATRSLAFHHRGVALRGLHEAIGEFSQENSDAVLAASVILSWQAIDWRGWASLMTGIRTVINAMQPWKTESHYQDLIAEQGTIKFQSMAHPSQPQSDPNSRRGSLTILQHIYTALQKLHPYLAGRESEMRWVEQLKAYLQKIRISTPAQSPEEQFIQLYILRKWLFWVPVSLISQQGRDFSVLVVMAYLYATALAIEPLFPDVGAPFCAEMSARPLEEILATLNMLNTARGHVQNAYTAAAALLEFPREALTDYRARSAFEQQQAERTGLVRRTSYGLENVNQEIENYFAEYRHRDGMSPGFPPSPLHFPPGAMGSGPTSPFLELPRTNSMGDSYSSGSSYGSPLTTPSLPRDNSSQGEQYQAAFNGFSFAGGPHSDGWHGGQVQRQDQSPYDEYFGKGRGKGRQGDSGV